MLHSIAFLEERECVEKLGMMSPLFSLCMPQYQIEASWALHGCSRSKEVTQINGPRKGDNKSFLHHLKHLYTFPFLQESNEEKHHPISPIKTKAS